jgi:hypothetical protein
MEKKSTVSQQILLESLVHVRCLRLRTPSGGRLECNNFPEAAESLHVHVAATLGKCSLDG